jgi:hypothetical protein
MSQVENQRHSLNFDSYQLATYAFNPIYIVILSKMTEWLETVMAAPSVAKAC